MRTTLFLSSLLLLASACRDSELTVAKPFSRTATTATTAATVQPSAGPEQPLAYDDEPRPTSAAPTEVTTRTTETVSSDPWDMPATVTTTTKTTTTASTAGAGSKSGTPTTSSEGPIWIETTCEDASAESQLAQIKQDNASAREVSIGKAGVIVDKGNRQQLTAWDADSNCHVDVTAPHDVDTVSIARTVLSQLPGRG